MNSQIRMSLVLAVSLAVAACGGASANAPAAVTTTTAGAFSLDGATYDVTLVFPGEPSVQDTLRFANGKFESSACTPLGFPQWSDYRVRVESGASSFDVTAQHPAGTTMEWRGTIKEGAVEGTATRTMNGQRSVAHFKGAQRS